jgi:hypothetical protein
MEFVMTGFHLAVIVAIIVTAPLVSNLYAIAAADSARTKAGARARLRLGLHRSPRRVKRLVDTWVAVMLVRRERQAAIWAAERLPGRAGTSPHNSRIGPGRLR